MSKIEEILFPRRCIGCGALLDASVADRPFCEYCHARWEFGKLAAKTAHNGQPTRAFTKTDGEQCGRVMFLNFYEPHGHENVENRLVFSLKDRAGRRAVDFAARELAAMIQRNMPFLDAISENTVITWVPRRRSAVRAHGFDHMERVAKSLARYLSVSAERLIYRKVWATEQKRLVGAARRRNARSTMALTKGTLLYGKTVILIDDIVTTGASLEAAAELVMGAGAEQVVSAVLCASEYAQADEYLTENGFNMIKNRKSKA